MNHKIRNRMMFYILSGITVIMSFITLVIVLFFFYKEKENVYNQNLLTAGKYSNEIASFIRRYQAVSQTFADTQRHYKGQNRAEVLSMLREVIEKDHNMVGFCVAYEPNKFDGKDNLFSGQPGHDSTGRFIPYWNRLKGNLALEPLMDTDTSDWYLMPKKTGAQYITDPIIYDGVLMVSIDTPILKNGEFFGITALDLSLETIQKLLKSFEQKKTYPSNYAMLISSKTLLILSSSRNLFKQKEDILNKTILDIAEGESVPELSKLGEEIKNHREGFISIPDPVQGEDSIMFYVPVNGTDFSFVVSVSNSDLMANTRRVSYILGFGGIFFLLVIGVILYFTVNSIVKPLNHLTGIVEKFSEQNFSHRARIFLEDEVGKLARTFNSMADDIVGFRNEMEEKVRIRTEELNRSLETTISLKQQQDGDYFLTTLITEPLMKNRSKSDYIKIDFTIRQKKLFYFKKKEYRIGGDVCISGDLNFNGETYSMFFNGDAMGKSMQGAGGALVIGSALNSIMARSASRGKILNCLPEEWLKDTFWELQRVMESFGGSMFVSGILGIIKCSTGYIQYFNAEHPYPILYRDGKADFTARETTAFKIGSPFNTSLKILNFQMVPGDVFLCGSDGKDDLVLSEENGTRQINDNENLILDVVARADADPERILEILSGHGDIFDDISLLKITYLNSPLLYP